MRALTASLSWAALGALLLLPTLVRADAPVGQFTPLGRLDARSTAVAQLALYEVQSEAGSSLAGTPPTALAGLLRTMGEAPTPALEALVTFVQTSLDAAPTDGGGRAGGGGERGGSVPV